MDRRQASRVAAPFFTGMTMETRGRYSSITLTGTLQMMNCIPALGIHGHETDLHQGTLSRNPERGDTPKIRRIAPRSKTPIWRVSSSPCPNSRYRQAFREFG